MEDDKEDLGLPSPAALVRAGEISDLLFNAINEIASYEEKLVLLSRFYLDLSREETGARLGVSCEYARQLESRAIASLSERVKGYAGLDDLDASHYCKPDMDKVTGLYRRLLFKVIQGGKSYNSESYYSGK